MEGLKMKTYEEPTIDIEIFETVDIIITSEKTWNSDIETQPIWEK